jgi:hypothetical protein
LWLLGASHLPPYTDEQPQLGIVERLTTAFLDHYLKDGPLRALDQAARSPGLTRFTADPYAPRRPLTFRSCRSGHPAVVTNWTGGGRPLRETA